MLAMIAHERWIPSCRGAGHSLQHAINVLHVLRLTHAESWWRRFGSRVPRLPSSPETRVLQLVVVQFGHSVSDHIQRVALLSLVHLSAPQQASFMPHNILCLVVPFILVQCMPYYSDLHTALLSSLR